jgi:hypothetical protein
VRKTKATRQERKAKAKAKVKRRETMDTIPAVPATPAVPNPMEKADADPGYLLLNDLVSTLPILVNATTMRRSCARMLMIKRLRQTTKLGTYRATASTM